MNTRHVLILFLLFVSVYSKASEKSVLVWMCLEICNATTGDVLQNLVDIWNHQDVVTYVSFEKYTLSATSTFTDFSSEFNLTNVAPLLPPSVKQLPMLSSYPHPPGFLDYMRTLFTNPSPFIDAAVQEAIKYNYAGFNVDFEPTTAGTEEDAKNYALFLTTFADAMHKAGKILTVDVASWNVVWNFTLIGASDVDQVHSMDTYVKNFTYFQEYLQKAVSTIPLEKLGAGLEVFDSFAAADWEERFTLINKANVNEVAIWDMPIPDVLWTQLQQFMDN